MRYFGVQTWLYDLNFQALETYLSSLTPLTLISMPENGSFGPLRVDRRFLELRVIQVGTQ